MKRDGKSKSIIKKYEKLHEECSKYPRIVLGDVDIKPKIYREPEGYAKNAFIEKFCKLLFNEKHILN